MAMIPSPHEMMFAAPASVAEHRLRVQHAEEERAAIRASELAAQVSPAKDADERIRIWEQLHALRLPRTSGHVLVNVIATQTCLTVGQVHEEQRRRVAVVARSEAMLPKDGAVPQSQPAQVADPATLPSDR